MQWFRPMAQRPYVLTGILTAVIVLGLHGGASWSGVGGGFFNGHTWVVSHLAEMLSGQVPLTSATVRVGAPDGADLRLIAWVPVLFAAPLSWVLGAPAATWLVTILGLWASWAVTAALIRRLVDLSVWASLGAAATYVFGAYALGILANGQLAKLQLWCLPLLLLCVDRLLREGRPGLSTLTVLISSVVMGFTSPSIALVMPPAVLVWVLVRCRRTPRGCASAFCGLLVAALGLLPAYLYHSIPALGVAGFAPAAPVPGLNTPVNLSPVATLTGLLGVGLRWDRAAAAVNNVCAVGVPALLAGVLVLIRFPRVASAGLVLSVVGIALAFGPEYQTGETLWILPAALMERSGYPLSESGMYYRFVQVAALGLAICVAHIVGRNRSIGLGFIGASLLQAFVTTSDLWPRPVTAIPNADLLASIAQDPEGGGIIEFPLGHLDTEGGRRLLGQLVHRRPTSALSRNIVVRGVPRLERLQRLSQSGGAAAGLRAEGFRYVLLHNPSRESALLRVLSARLGQPSGDSAVAIWRLP